MPIILHPDPHLADAMSFRKAIDEIWHSKKKWITGIWAPGSEAEGVVMKWYGISLFHWAKKSKAYKEFGHEKENFPEETESIKMEETMTTETTRRKTFGPLQFEYGGEIFGIEFMRFRKEIPDHAWNPKKMSLVGARPKTSPYTKVNVLKLRPGDEPNEVYRTFTVGCYHRDQFTLEDGHRAALRMALKANSDKLFTAAVFRCYFGRTLLQELTPSVDTVSETS